MSHREVVPSPAMNVAREQGPRGTQFAESRLSKQGQREAAPEVCFGDSPQPNGWGAGQLLALQRTLGNHAVQELVAPSRTFDRANEATQRNSISRQPQSPGPASTTGTAAQGPALVPGVAFNPTFEITPGGLAPGAARTQTMVFRGDRLTFRGKVSNITPTDTEFGVAGRVASAASAPSFTLAGDTIAISTTVGNMGQLRADLAQPPDLVDAKPYAKLKIAPFTGIGDRIFNFKVVADMAWLSGQCTTAGSNLQSAFMGMASLVDQVYLDYDEAYQLHKTAVDNHGKRKQLQNDILLGILLAGIGGAAGGKVADLLKAENGVVVATAVGDVTKYMVRLTGVRTSSSTGQHGPDTANPASSAGNASAAGVPPARWKALKEKECLDAAKAAIDICAALKVKMDEAWAQGKTDLMDVDPVQVVAPTVQSLQKHVEVKSRLQYSIELWRTWLHTYGITAHATFGGGQINNDETAGHTAFTDSKLFDDIHAQVGTALDSEVAKLRQETAVDPLLLPD